MSNLRNVVESLGLDCSDYSDEEISQAFEEYPVLWILKHNLKNEGGFPIEFEKRRYQIDMYNDLSPKQVVLKPPQIGETTKNLIKSFFVAKKLHRDIIYTLPTESDVVDMAGGKINRIIAQNPLLQSWTKDKDSVEQKRVGNNTIYYRGTFVNRAAMMVSSGLNMHDEVDASNAEVIKQYETRLEAQEGEENKWRWYFSHPSIAGYGVDIFWNQSDKKEWVITCEHCGKQQILTWPESIDPERECYQCKYCKGEISDHTRIWGEWKPTAQGEFSGYHVSQLMLYNKSAKDILAAKNDPNTTEQYFYNYVLGLPYVGSENKIPSSVVLKNVVPEVNEQGDRIIIGVDPGMPIHFTVMNKQGVFYYGTCSDKDELGNSQDPWDDLRKLMRRWPEAIMIVDGNGDSTIQRRIHQEFMGRVYLCFYRKDRKSKEMVTWGEGDEMGTVRVDRNAYFQWMVEQLRDTGRIRLDGQLDEWTEWAGHFDNVYREIKTTIEKPGKDNPTNYGVELIWKRNGPDHYCHTLLYCLVGLEKYGSPNATFIKKDDIIRFPKAGRADNSIPARRVLGKKVQGYVDF